MKPKSVVESSATSYAGIKHVSVPELRRVIQKLPAGSAVGPRFQVEVVYGDTMK